MTLMTSMMIIDTLLLCCLEENIEAKRSKEEKEAKVQKETRATKLKTAENNRKNHLQKRQQLLHLLNIPSRLQFQQRQNDQKNLQHSFQQLLQPQNQYFQHRNPHGILR